MEWAINRDDDGDFAPNDTWQLFNLAFPVD